MSNSIEEIIEATIGHDSLYILEKSGVAIYEGDINDIRFAKGLLNSYKENFEELYRIINQHPGYNPDNSNFEFELLIFAINKLLGLLGNTTSKENQLEASVYQKALRSQDSYIRLILKEIER